MSFGRGEWVFVDESKAHGYYIAAAAVARGDIAGIEKRLRALRMGNRGSLHFHSEGNRRAKLLHEFCQMDVWTACRFSDTPKHLVSGHLT